MPTRVISSISSSEKGRERICDSRSDYHSRVTGQPLPGWEGGKDKFPYPAPIFGLEYLFSPALIPWLQTLLKYHRATGRYSGTFYFDIISYFTLKWDKWNCSLSIRRRPHFPPLLLFLLFLLVVLRLLRTCRDAFQSVPVPENREYDSREIKMFDSSILLPPSKKRYWIWKCPRRRSHSRSRNRTLAIALSALKKKKTKKMVGKKGKRRERERRMSLISHQNYISLFRVHARQPRSFIPDR